DETIDPLRLPEIIIILCVLLLWLLSIFVFIRHSELLRIRHRDLPYKYGNIKPPMNLNHVLIVDRTSETVIHSKRGYSLCLKLPAFPHESENKDDNSNIDDKNLVTLPLPLKRHTQSFDYGNSEGSRQREEKLLKPYQIPSIVRRSLLDLHKATHEMSQPSTSRSFTKYLSSLSVNKNQLKSSSIDKATERVLQESPV
ncbi:unnamed protein product, partial [Didymodactylos carnosus]